MASFVVFIQDTFRLNYFSCLDFLIGSWKTFCLFTLNLFHKIKMILFVIFQLIWKRLFYFVCNVFCFCCCLKNHKCFMKLIKKIIKIIFANLLKIINSPALAFRKAFLFSLSGLRRALLEMTFWTFNESLDFHIFIKAIWSL